MTILVPLFFILEIYTYDIHNVIRNIAVQNTEKTSNYY